MTMDEKVLEAVQVLQPKAYGLTISNYIQSTYPRWWYRLLPPAIYNSLARLELNGELVSSWEDGPAPPERKGYRRRLYFIREEE